MLEKIIQTPEQDHDGNWLVYWQSTSGVHSASYRSLDDALFKIALLNQLKQILCQQNLNKTFIEL